MKNFISKHSIKNHFNSKLNHLKCWYSNLENLNSKFKIENKANTKQKHWEILFEKFKSKHKQTPSYWISIPF